MPSPPSSPKPKLGMRKYFHDQYDRFFRSHPRSLSQQSLGVSESSAHPTNPAPRERSSTTTGNFLAPPLDEQVLRGRSRSESHLAPDPPPATRTRSAGGLALAGLRTALGALREAARVLPPLESAISSLITCLDLMEATAKHHQEYKAISSELKTLSEALTRHLNGSTSVKMSDCIANVALGIEQQAQSIIAKYNRGTGRRIMEAGLDEDEVMGHYRRIELLFRQLQIDANLSTWSIANEHLANTRLEGLMPAKMANYDSALSMEISRRSCTEGTRTAILAGMDDWSCDPQAPDMYWMSGMAGTGKTTIACSFSNQLEERKQLAASFFCTRTSPECRQVIRIVPTIAYQLARYSIPFQSALCEVLGSDPDIGSKNIVKQFERLLKGPLLRVKEAIPENLVVVIDALDECDDRRGVALLLDLFFKFSPVLPLKFFVTSRPEPEIYQKMAFRSQFSQKVLHLHEIEKSLVRADIELYLKEELASMPLGEDQIEQLVERSGNLFIYAATLVRYVQLTSGSYDSQRRLRSILAATPESTSKYAEIDALYTAVLDSALGKKGIDSEEAEDVRAVLQTVLCVQEPISIEALASLTGTNDNQRTFSALQPLRSVLHFSEVSGLVSTLHASFPDFMFTPERSGSFFCDVNHQNQVLAQSCFKLMKEQLRFNICNLASSFIPDTSVEDLGDRADKTISAALSYTCRYWGIHLQQAAISDELCTMLEEFLSNRLLFWMEVLNLKRHIAIGAEMLLKTKLWLQSSPKFPELVRFAEDAQNFVTSYTANPTSQSTPHIYISSLLLCPRSSLVFKHYSPRTQGLPDLKGGGMEQREAAALATWPIGWSVRSISYSSDGTRVAFGCTDGMMGIRSVFDGTTLIGPLRAHSDIIWSVAFSPDGNRLASGSDDNTIKIWGTHDGLLVHSLEGHTGGVKSVAYSHDGLHIVSGAADQKIRLWHANNGTPAAEPFTGHTGNVWSAAFSQDDTRIISGSADRTIRIWDPQNGTPIGSPLRGHTSTVWSAVFSPDGQRIVSGSSDRTVRLWKVQGGTLISQNYHDDDVYSVAFSRDGARIVSGSRDNSIKIWSSEDGSLVAGPFEGHTDCVWSVTFSYDGMRVLSGCGDRTIRIWNARAGLSAIGQFNGHNDTIWSIAFAPDGSSIASGSIDLTIRVWGADGTPLAEPFKGHTDAVKAIAISPDGLYLASSSRDRTIRVWDIHDGRLIAGPLKGHTKLINSVAFSPDGTCLASGSDDTNVLVWNKIDGKFVSKTFEGHTNVIMSVLFSPDGNRIVSGAYDRTIRVWDRDNGTLVYPAIKGHTNWIMTVACSPNGKYIASGSKDRSIRLWNANNGTAAGAPITDHTDMVHSVAFSPDSARIVSGSFDRTTRVWSTADGTQIAGPFYGHTHWVTSVAFSPDGTRIVTGSGDHTIRMWDATGTHVPNSDLGNWVLKDDGWITDRQGKLLLWVPQEVLRSLITPHCTFIISRFGTTTVDFSRALMGPRWAECYTLN